MNWKRCDASSKPACRLLPQPVVKRPQHAARRPHPVALALTIALACWIPAALPAQEAGALRGRVVDAEQQPVAGARVAIRPLSDAGAEFAVETAADGTYASRQLGAGLYAVTAAKDDLRGDMFRVRVRPGRTVRINVELAAGRRDATWIAELGDRESASRAFAAGVRASRNDDHPAAIEQFTLALARTADCAACHYNLAIAHTALDQFASAETAFQRVIELQPDYAAAYYGLASLYARQGRDADAAAARDEATRLARERLAERLRQLDERLQRAVARLDAGDAAGALTDLETLLKHDSSFPPTHYWLAMAALDSDDTGRARTEFRRYLELAPDGAHAAQARTALGDLGR